jgi:drug/metabolite transporter (DMT)-like permease
MVGHFGMVDITAARFAVFGAISGGAVFARPAAVRWPNGRQALAALGFSDYYLLLAFGIATGLGALLLWVVAGSDMATLLSKPDGMLFIWVALAGGFGSSWLATILWNVASQRLSASLCGQLIVSETLFALLCSFIWDGRWPQATEWVTALLFVLGILASIKAHR